MLAADGLGEDAVLRFLAEAFELEFVDGERLEKSPPSKEFLSLFPARRGHGGYDCAKGAQIVGAAMVVVPYSRARAAPMRGHAAPGRRFAHLPSYETRAASAQRPSRERPTSMR